MLCSSVMAAASENRASPAPAPGVAINGERRLGVLGALQGEFNQYVVFAAFNECLVDLDCLVAAVVAFEEISVGLDHAQ